MNRYHKIDVQEQSVEMDFSDVKSHELLYLVFDKQPKGICCLNTLSSFKQDSYTMKQRKDPLEINIHSNMANSTPHAIAIIFLT